jgi:hypothetical protein
MMPPWRLWEGICPVNVHDRECRSSRGYPTVLPKPENPVQRSLTMALGLALILYAGAASGLQVLHVSVETGNDAWLGDADHPLASLRGARDAIREIKSNAGLPPGGIEVRVRAGTYRLAHALEFGEEDAGTADAPIVYRASRKGTVRLSGGVTLNGFVRVTNPQVLARLDPGVRDKVWQINLREHMPELGETVTLEPRLELFFNDHPMTLARWPNEGYTLVKEVPPQDESDGTGGQFIYLDDRVERWVNEKEVWLHGYWRYQWSDEHMQVASIDPQKRLVTLAPPRHRFGYSRNKPFYALNLLCELDQPGEWHLDHDSGTLYFYPPAPLAQGRVEVSRAPSILRLTAASYLTFSGFTLEATQGDGVVIDSCTAVTIVSCTLRNLGNLAVSIRGGRQVRVVGCDISETGNGGIVIIGGDRQTLIPANHAAINNHIVRVGRWRRMNSPGINLAGVGNRAAHNLIHDLPHSAIWFGGNDMVIEFNEIHSVCYEANDAGAIYTGRNWTCRGNVVRNNFFHDVHGLGGRFVMGIYLDDMFSSVDIHDNLFYRVLNSVVIGGGRDNSVTNNIFVESGAAVTVDARALQSWADYHANGWLEEQRKDGTISGIAFDQPPHSERYPRLAAIMDGTPKAPEGNLIARNISFNGRWDNITADAAEYLRVEDNLVDVDPHFVDDENLNFQLRDDSPALKLGFERFPIERVGLIDDATRASWPVQHTVRPFTRQRRPWPTPPDTLLVPHLAGAIEIDGILGDSGWGGDAAAVLVNENLSGDVSYGLEGGDETADSRAGRAWVVHDGTHLLIAADNPVSQKQPIRPGNVWGLDDAIEIAVCRETPGIRSPILVLRGFPSGHFESSQEANAPSFDAQRAAEGVQYAAMISLGAWTAEWRIPFASLGIDPALERGLAFNITVRKTADNQWRLWRGTGTSTWEVFEAGFIELE